VESTTVCKQQAAYYGASILTLVGVIAAIGYLMFVPRVSVEEVTRDIDAHVQPGTSRSDVRSWLMAHPRIRYQGEIANKNTGQIEGMGAYVPDAGPRWETPERIEIAFFFQDDKLTHIEVERSKTPFISPSP
jgi:hypothetical protein